MARQHLRLDRGFTLVEILIVVVILGILAATVVPQFTVAAEDSRRGAFIHSLSTFEKAAEAYNAKYANYPADSGTGQLPDEPFRSMIDGQRWVRPTPIGGSWDMEQGGVGVHFQGDDPGLPFMEVVDATFDDGDLTTGRFQNVGSGRYYIVLDPNNPPSP